MKKSIYFNAIGLNLPLQRSIQKFVLNSKFAFFLVDFNLNFAVFIHKKIQKLPIYLQKTGKNFIF